MSNAQDEADRCTGTVEWFDGDRGVGQILPDDGGAPCSVDAEALRACGLTGLSAGDRVRFRIQSGAPGGRAAIDLELVNAVQRWENEGGALPAGPPNG